MPWCAVWYDKEDLHNSSQVVLMLLPTATVNSDIFCEFLKTPEICSYTMFASSVTSHTSMGVFLHVLHLALFRLGLVHRTQGYSIPARWTEQSPVRFSLPLSCQMVPRSGACENHLNCSINCLCAEKQYLK